MTNDLDYIGMIAECHARDGRDGFVDGNVCGFTGDVVGGSSVEEMMLCCHDFVM